MILLEELEREEEREEEVRVLAGEDLEMREGDALLKDREEEEDLMLGEV